MIDWTVYPTYSNYRTLHRTDPPQRGFDVYALQIALNAINGSNLALDGILGDHTQAQIKPAQKAVGAKTDGKAGGETQLKLALKLAHDLNTGGVPEALVHGQVEHESSGRLGCKSALRNDGTYDAGVVQRNTEHTPAQEGFQPIHALAAYLNQTAEAFRLFEGVAPDRRRWALAAGSWNAPAFAAWIAREEGARKVRPDQVLRPTDSARATLEAYIASACAHME